MRGSIIDYKAVTGEGLISGDDGARYAFGPNDIGRAAGLRVGAQVDFEIRDGRATGIFPLAAPNTRVPERDLGLWGYFIKCMKMYVDGRGRASRKEFWSFVLFGYLSMILVVLLGGMAVALLAGQAHAQSTMDSDPADAAGAAVVLLFWLIRLPFIPPYFAVSARRWHDIGASGWLALLILIPYAGTLIMLVAGLIPSQPTRNEYDRSPDTSVF